MFSNKAQLKRRTPENGTDREDYLSLLVDEYINTNSFDAKCQVLANLANFAYDPINYGYIRKVGVLDIFIHVLKVEKNEKLIRFAVCGICNLSIDPENIEYILNNEGLKLIYILLKSSKYEIVADAITILIYLYNSHAKQAINCTEIKEDIQNLKKSENTVISNLATILLDNVNESLHKNE